MSVTPLSPLAARIDAWLPQTQCTRCGYPRCRDYARAVAAGQADINQCPPGGDITLHALAGLVGVPPKPLNPAFGATAPRRLARIDETLCIGCRKCIDACPVDAILGARRLMHTVLIPECTGCELCLPPCPVDCIEMITPPVNAISAGAWPDYGNAETGRWRRRALARLTRLAETRATPAQPARSDDKPDRKAEIRAAVERARRKRQNRNPPAGGAAH